MSKNKFNHRTYQFKSLIGILFSTVCLFSISITTTAMTLEEQRKQYKEAKKALRSGKIETFRKLSANLKDYPLHPYLRYNYLNSRLHKTSNEEIKYFFDHYDDLPLANNLRTKWLKYLAKTKQWQIYYDNYTAQKDTDLQCYQLQARIHSGNKTYLLEDIRTVWLSGKSQPPQCDPAFALLYKSELMTNELVWERVRLVMANGNVSLTSYLSKRLDNYYREWAIKWINVHNNPDKWTKNSNFNDTALAREILIHAIQRLAKININRSIKNWQNLQMQYEFSPQDVSETNRLLAVRAARKKHPDATDLLDNINNYYVNDDVFHWRLITALQNSDWKSLHKWTKGIAPYEDIELRWKYWHARALENIGNTEKAAKIFSTISRTRDYYSFLAADRLGRDYKLHYTPLPDNPLEKSKIAKIPGIIRANELRKLNENYQARREWHHALKSMTSYQKEIAATLARDWGWDDRAIFTMGSAHSYDDLKLRFPIQFKTIFDKNINNKHLDPGWVYALVRTESAFMEDAISPAGALGLMQIMPQTGRQTAKYMGWKKFSKNDLLKAEKNIPIGTTYLKQMLDLFDGNNILATAAYNAGPHRVKKWLPKTGCIEPDIWVEKIPFNETRKYVRRVMFYASIYDWRLQKKITPLNQRMAAIISQKSKMVANLSCKAQSISYN